MTTPDVTLIVLGGCGAGVEVCVCCVFQYPSVFITMPEWLRAGRKSPQTSARCIYGHENLTSCSLIAHGATSGARDAEHSLRKKHQTQPSHLLAGPLEEFQDQALGCLPQGR